MSMSFAAQVNSVMAALILLTSFGLLVQRRILGLIHLFAWQGLFLCISTAIVGYITGMHHLFISSLLTLSLKVSVAYILYVLVRKQASEEAKR
jgi:hydrogenase-4 component E